MAFLEQEAENAHTNGTVIGPDRTAYTLPSEASGRAAVRLAPGQYVEFTLPHRANAITVRYSIPDAPGGGGITAPLGVSVNGTQRATLTLTSQYAWLYNQYPFTNDPNADLLHPDWWITECDCVPAQTNPPPVIRKPFRPSHFYDEQRLVRGRTYRTGDTVRLTASDRAGWTVIDLLDSELVGPPRKVAGALDVRLFGADPTGRRDAAPAIERTIALARVRGVPVYLPPGTGVGFYGRAAADGGSENVHLSGFAIEGDVRERIDTDQVNAVGGAMSDSSITGLYLHHTKVGLWFDGPMSRVEIRDNIIVDQVADALNFHTGVTDSVVANNFVRNTGDDGLAMWSEHTQNARNAFDRNTVQSPVLANGIALYGGTDNTVSNNLVADPVREGSGIQLGSRFGARPFTGQVLVVGNHFLDNTYNAIMFVSEWSVKDQYSITGVHFADTRIDGTGTSVLSARSRGGTSFENTDARHVGAVGVNNCGSFNFPPTGSEFTLTDAGGNDGWLADWMLPNTITCDDRPQVVPPPPPAPW